MDFAVRVFGEINLADPFFDSLKADYKEFPVWFQKKAQEPAYVSCNDQGLLNGFLYLKVEDGPLSDVTPPLSAARRLKVGTLKIDAHGTRLGERFIKKVMDHALHAQVDEIYVTIFAAHVSLSKLFERYGFQKVAEKISQNGTENVLARPLPGKGDTLLRRYPYVCLKGSNVFLLGLQPQWHTRLLPDSILKNESTDIVQDVSHTNSIHKVYLGAMRGMAGLRAGDILVVYRTSDGQGPAYYRSVATSVCVMEEYRNISSFSSLDEFLDYCGSYSVFTLNELRDFYSKQRYPHVIRFTYNIALKKRVTRKVLLEEIGVSATEYAGFQQINHQQLLQVLKHGGIDESLVVN